MNQVSIALIVGLLYGCSGCDTDTSSQQSDVSAERLIVPGERVGPWTIDRDSLASILGSDTPEARRQFAAQGVQFQFDRGGPLTGVTVSNADYQTEHGLRVGSDASAVESTLGAPRTRQIEGVHGKVVIPALVFDGVSFQVANDVVVAIFVGRS